MRFIVCLVYIRLLCQGAEVLNDRCDAEVQVLGTSLIHVIQKKTDLVISTNYLNV
jgi:hypothetical protein